MRKISNYIKENGYELAILVILFCSLAYCLNGTFNFDDVCYYYFRGQSYLDGSSLFDIIRNGEKTWLLERGRFFPLNIPFEYVYYYVFNDWFSYELLIILATCFDVLLFGCLIYEISYSKRNKLLGMLIIVVFFQVYGTYHNALIGYGALFQISALFLISQLILLIKYLKTSDKKWFALSCFFELLGVMWYEVNYINIVLVFTICCWLKKESFHTKLRESIICSFPTIVCGMITVILRIAIPSSYQGTTISFDFIKIVKTFFIQMYAVLPLSHYFAQKNNGIISLKNISFWDCALAVILFGLFMIVLKNFEKREKKLELGSLLLSIGATIVPGMLTPLTAKYQSELYYGIAHMSVFIQYFGLSAVFLWIYLFIENYVVIKHKYISMKLIQGASAVILSMILLINLQVTKSNISAVSNAVKYPKESIITAIEKGLLDDVKDNDVVISIKNAPWDSDSFFSEYAKKRIPALYYPVYVENYNEYKETKYFINYSGTATGKSVVMCCSEGIQISDDGGIVLPTQELFLYTEGDGYIELERENISNKIGQKGEISKIEMGEINFMDLQLF